ncbi:MAG: ABC transporter ATP-binding protein [Ideonella sp.]|nr:ABC transporter ATP-binding protein [Ideonella sp.]
MSFLTLVDVTKAYGDVAVVEGFNLSVEQGEFVSLLGPSGCGKTTTLQMVAGFVDVSRGQITLGGRDITHATPNSRGLGIVFQSYALFPHMSVWDNVSFGLEMRQVPRQQRQERVDAALGLVGLSKLAQRYPRELSGGQRQRVALARALVIEPPVLLLDEPLSNLDAKLREDMQFELRQIQRKVGTTTVMVTHDQTEALSISDRVVVMQAGRITQVDAPFKLYEHPRTRFISGFVGKANLVPMGTGGALASLRPEKLRFVPAGAGQVDGEVRERFFLGSQWLYRVDSALGELVVVCPNDGTPRLDEGARCGLAWPDDALRPLANEARTA